MTTTETRLRILLVEPAGAALGVTRQALSYAGFEIETAQSATEAVSLLAVRRYAAIVADACVPGLPPLDWLAAIRGVAPKIPLIVHCASIQIDQLRDQAEEFRAAAVLEPPVSPAQLVEAVRRALGHAE